MMVRSVLTGLEYRQSIKFRFHAARVISSLTGRDRSATTAPIKLFSRRPTNNDVDGNANQVFWKVVMILHVTHERQLCACDTFGRSPASISDCRSRSNAATYGLSVMSTRIVNRQQVYGSPTKKYLDVSQSKETRRAGAICSLDEAWSTPHIYVLVKQFISVFHPYSLPTAARCIPPPLPNPSQKNLSHVFSSAPPVEAANHGSRPCICVIIEW
jgi:hypothetical protein